MGVLAKSFSHGQRSYQNPKTESNVKGLLQFLAFVTKISKLFSIHVPQLVPLKGIIHFDLFYELEVDVYDDYKNVSPKFQF